MKKQDQSEVTLPQNKTGETVDLGRKFLRPNTIIALIVSVVVVYIFLRRFDLGQTLRILTQINIWLFGAALLIFYLSLPLRGHRWQVLLKESRVGLPVHELSRYYLLAWFANCLLPARIGDIYRAFLLKKNRAVSFSLSLAVLFSEKIFDLASTAILVLLGGWFYFDKINQPNLRRAIISGLIIIGLIIAMFTIFAWRGGLLRKLIPQKFRNYYESFRQGLFRSPKKIPLVALESLVIWLSEAARLFLVALALGARIDFLLAVFISQASLILMSLPLTPAGLGLVELLMLTLFQQAGLANESAAALVIADRLISFWSLILFGGIHYLMSPRKR